MALISIDAFQPFPEANGYSTTRTVLRVWYGQSFTDSDGVFVESGNGSSGFYIPVACTIVDGTIHVPSFELRTTVDAESVNPQSIQCFARLYSSNSPRAWVFSQSDTPNGWIIPNPTPLTSMTIEQLALVNATTVLENPPLTFWTAAQVQQYFDTLSPAPFASDVTAGITFLDVAPVSALHPEAVGSNSWASTSHFGISRLSVAPAVAPVPIAVGDNDPRVPSQSGNVGQLWRGDLTWANSLQNSDLGTTLTTGLSLSNVEPSDVFTTRQFSPTLDLFGSAWDTGFVASQPSTWRFVSEPVSGNPVTGRLVLAHRIGSGPGVTTTIASLTSAGLFTTIGGIIATTGDFSGALNVTGNAEINGELTLNESLLFTGVGKQIVAPGDFKITDLLTGIQFADDIISLGDIQGVGNSTLLFINDPASQFEFQEGGDTFGLLFKSAGVGALTLGNSGASLSGQLNLAGSTSGLITIKSAAAAGTWMLTLPINDGSASQVLITDGNGVTSWATASSLVGTVPTTQGGTGLTSYTQGDLLYASASNVLSKLAKNASASRYLSNQGASNGPTWSEVDLSNGTTGLLPLASINAKIYMAMLSQSGTNAPVLTEIINTTGQTITSGYTSVGIYTLIAGGATFTANKTGVVATKGNFLGNGDATGYWSSTTSIILKTSDAAGAPANDVFTLGTVLVITAP